MKTITLIFLLLFSSVATIAQNSKTIKSNLDSLRSVQVRLDKPEQAAKRALEFTGLESRIDTHTAATSVKVEKVIINDDVTPFLSNRINGREIWRVLYTDVDFRRPLLLNDSNVTNLRDIEIILDPKTGQLLRIIVSSSNLDSTLLPELSVQKVEEQVRLSNEIFHDFLDGLPEVRFIDAVFVGVGCMPWAANMIIAQLITQSNLDGEINRVWHFICLDVPITLATFGGTYKDVDRARCVVDATTGVWLEMSSAPY